MSNIKLELKESFEPLVEGTIYELPVYTVVDGKGIELTNEKQTIKFVRGSKIAEEEVDKVDGTLHEHLLGMMIHDLQYKNSLVPSRESSLAITKLQEGLHWLRERQVNRMKRGVQGTYKK